MKMFMLLKTAEEIDTTIGKNSYHMGDGKIWPAHWRHLLGTVVEVEAAHGHNPKEGQYWMINKGDGAGTINETVYEGFVTKEENPEYFL